MQVLLDLIVLGVANGFVYALIAIGFVLIFKSSGVLNLAVGDMAMVGAYVFYGLAVQLGLGIHLAIIGVLVLAWLSGLIIERGFLRPLVGQPILAMIIMILALGGLLRGIMALIWGPYTLYAPELLGGTGSISIGNFTVSSIHAIFIVVSLGVVALLGVFYRFTNSGLSMRAISEDVVLARSLGMKTNSVLALVWAIAGVITMTAGILLTNVMGIHYTLVELGFKAMAVALVGGLESLIGVLIIGSAIGVIEVFGAYYLNPMVGGDMEVLLPWLVLMVVLFFRPYGLFGWERIERV